jgi:hypothetical protein
MERIANGHPQCDQGHDRYLNSPEMTFSPVRKSFTFFLQVYGHGFVDNAMRGNIRGQND